MPDNHTVSVSYSAQDAIRRRKSIRTYQRQPVPAPVQEQIRKYILQLKGPFSAKVRIALVDRGEALADAGVKLGTYGVVQGASIFAAAAVKKDGAHALEQVGYLFEDLVLYVTSLGLGTCWLGGSFNRSGFSKAMNLEENEILPIVSPVGFSSDRKGFIDRLIKPQPGRVIRKPWESLFFLKDLFRPLGQEEAGAYALPLEMVRLAPSASNRQPWRIVKEGDNFHFYLAHDPIYATGLGFDIQKVDMGIALFHWEASAREQGLSGCWRSFPDALSGLPKGLEYIITWEAR